MRGLLPIILYAGPDSAGANDSVDSAVEGPRVSVDAVVESTDLSVGNVGADGSVTPERSASMPATTRSAATPPITSQLMRGGCRMDDFYALRAHVTRVSRRDEVSRRDAPALTPG